MEKTISDNQWTILACPNCGNSLSKYQNGCGCKACNVTFEYTSSGSLDLRLRSTKKISHDFILGNSLIPESGFEFKLLEKSENTEVDFSSINVPFHLTKELLSYFPKSKKNGSIMLDLGCGNVIHRNVCEHAGYEYIGLDNNNDNAPILGDGHALPFKDESIDFVLSIAVLEHIRFPFLMMQEAHRVLKQGGKFVGTVAFLEPFHGDSYYHHTHLGTYNSLRQGGFIVEKIAPSDKWSGLIAQANMVLFPRMPRIFQNLIVMPVQLLHRLWWSISQLFTGRASEITRLLSTTGAFTFIARKDV